MDIAASIRRSGRDDITVRSVIANTVCEVYGKKCDIQSVQLKGKKIIIKTGKSILNSELQLLSGDIHKEVKKRLDQIGIGGVYSDSIFIFS